MTKAKHIVVFSYGMGEGLPFSVTADGAIVLEGDDRDLMRETLHFANTGQLRGGFLALDIRAMMIEQGVWNRYVAASFAAGAEPLKPTTKEQKEAILKVFSDEPLPA